MDAFKAESWAMYQKPFRIAPHVYYVSGQKGDAENALRTIFIDDCAVSKDLPVDITFSSHGNQTNQLAWVPEDVMDYSLFVDGSVWHDLMLERRAAAIAITALV